jgi:hypothetical protein
MKVEASKFTEVGYVGRDVESMIRDLVDIAIDMVREERLEEVGRPRRSQRRRAPAGSADAAARRPARATSAPAKSCASGCAKASSTSAWWSWK